MVDIDITKLMANLDELKEYRKLGTIEELSEAEREENILKFYYCDSEDSYLVGIRIDTLYYAHWNNGRFVFDMSRYLPWGHNGYPSEPRQMNFSEWLKGFLSKYITPEKEVITNFDACCVDIENMASVVGIMKAGWTKEQVKDWLCKPVEKCKGD